MIHSLKGNRVLYFIITFFCSIGTCISNLDIVENTNYFNDGLVIYNENDVKIINKLDDNDTPWCKSESILPFNEKIIINSLNSFDEYTKIFKRITSCKVISSNVVHVRLDMPYFISDRDYIVEYTMIEEKNKTIFAFDSGLHGYKNLVEGSVRLPNASGAWIVEPVSLDSTRVTYIWNGELLGDFPLWALSNAWETQGNEVFNWLNSYLSSN